MDSETTDKVIYNIHSAFLLEYSQATRSLSEFYEVVNSFFLRIIKENEELPNRANEQLEDNIRSIQDVCFFLKTFCSETKLYAQLMKSKNEEVVADPDAIEEMDCSDSAPENPNEIYPFEVYPDIFSYVMVDPSKFVVGVEDEFFVSFIKDGTSCLFFLMTASCSDIVINQPDFRYDVIPGMGTVFGLLLDGAIVRAVREKALKNQPKSFKVLLIDFGEIMEITKDFKMYRLPEEIQNLAGQAIFCKLSLDDNQNIDHETFLRDKLHTKQRIRIDRAYKNMLEVTFVPTLKRSNTTSSATKSLTAKECSSEILSNGAMPTTPSMSNHIDVVGPSTPSMPNHVDVVGPSTPSMPNHVDVVGPSSMNPFSEPRKRNESLTQDELDELYEEPMNTENALQAVMGYTPQDDKRICKFYDPKTNACFKGAHCKLEHTTILKDGWTKDQKLVKLNVRAKVPMPKVGKKINLFVSYVVDVDRFYAQVVHKNCKNTADLAGEQIFDKLNSSETKSKFKNLLQPPGEFELVFAAFTGDWYRAKILQKLSDIQYRVFYVDYGNCANITLTEMRQWDDAFDCYPFQALECKLDNIAKIKERDEKAIAYFEKLVFEKTVAATVTHNADILLVTLVDSDNFDIGDLLCAAEFAKSKPITKIANGQLPG